MTLKFQSSLPFILFTCTCMWSNVEDWTRELAHFLLALHINVPCMVRIYVMLLLKKYNTECKNFVLCTKIKCITISLFSIIFKIYLNKSWIDTKFINLFLGILAQSPWNQDIRCKEDNFSDFWGHWHRFQSIYACFQETIVSKAKVRNLHVHVAFSRWERIVHYWPWFAT